MWESFLIYRCIRGVAEHSVNANRQKIAERPFSNLSNPPKILRFFSKSGVTEIFRTSAAEADSEAILDIILNRRFHVAENFALRQVYRRTHDLLFAELHHTTAYDFHFSENPSIIMK
jgi:hypothetical protein